MCGWREEETGGDVAGEWGISVGGRNKGKGESKGKMISIIDHLTHSS